MYLGSSEFLVNKVLTSVGFLRRRVNWHYCKNFFILRLLGMVTHLKQIVKIQSHSFRSGQYQHCILCLFTWSFRNFSFLGKVSVHIYNFQSAKNVRLLKWVVIWYQLNPHHFFFGSISVHVLSFFGSWRPRRRNGGWAEKEMPSFLLARPQPWCFIDDFLKT